MKKDKDTLPISEAEATDIVKRKGNNPTGKGGFGDVEVLPGDNSRYLRHSLAMWNLPVIDISDPKQVEERILWYFQHCATDDMKPTVSGLAMALGVDRKTLYKWSVGESRDVTHSPIVKKAMEILQTLWEDYMQNGKINPVSGIFLGKNHFGYTDKQEIVVKPENPLGDTENPDEIKRKYLAENAESIVDDSSDND